MNDAERIDKSVEVLNKLSDDAFYLVSCDWFGQFIHGRSVLAAANNDRQQNAFDELMGVGFVYLDTEGGTVGYRSTDDGRFAHAVAVAK